MANLLTITKEDNEQFSFVVNGDVANEVINTRNDLLTVGDECHFKTANGANIIKEQQIIFSNVSLFDGVTPVASPVSVRDLFDKLTALEFFDWIAGTGGGGVDRFENLLDTFEFFGKAGQFVIVSSDELQLTTIEFTPVINFTDLADVPPSLLANKILKTNALGTAIEFIDMPIATDGINEEYEYTSGTPEFLLPTTKLLSAVAWNSVIMRKADWTQTGNILLINFTPNSGDIFQPIGNL